MKILKLARNIFFMALPLTANANVQGDLNGFFSNLGYNGNVTSGKAWQDQSAGYISGGSIYMRAPSRNIQLASINLPSFTSGCGGIDAYLGSFSFASGSEIEAFARSVMTNAQGYLFDLALSTTVPELKSAKDHIQTLLNAVNSANYNSCQVAQGIVGGMWPKTQESSQKICEDIAGEQNLFSDWAATKQACTTGGQQDSINNRATGARKDEVIKNKNFIWDALSNSAINSDKELKMFVMTLVGTVVYDANGKMTPYPSKIDDPDILRAIMYGDKSFEMYLCNTTTDPNCLSVTVDTKNLTRNGSMVSKVSALINSIKDKIVADTATMTAEEKGFINSTSMPVLKYLMVASSLGWDTGYLNKISDYIAEDLMLQYLKGLVKTVLSSTTGKNYSEQIKADLMKNIHRSEDKIRELQQEGAEKRSELFVVQEQILYMQKQLSSKLTNNYQANMRFGEGE